MGSPGTPIARRTFLAAGLAGIALATARFRPARGAASSGPVRLGFDGEFGLINSTSAQAIEKGIRVAIAEINRSGGVLGRPLELVVTDNRSVSARAIQNVRDLSAMPDLVAVMGGRFSPAVVECLPVVQEQGIPLLLPWSAADRLIDNGANRNYAFRLSLRDSWVVPALMKHAAAACCREVGMLAPNTAWGRGSFEAMQRYGESNPLPRSVATEWFNWGDQTMIGKYQALRGAGARAIVFIANDAEAVTLVNEMGELPVQERLPIVSHWGVTGGKFAPLVGSNLERVDFTVVQDFSFFRADQASAARVLDGLQSLYGVTAIEAIESPVGVAHAYDLTHILARAVTLAGGTDRRAVRDALEQVRNYDGLVKTFERPFTPSRHEALRPEDIFMARYAADGTIRPIDDAG